MHAAGLAARLQQLLPAVPAGEASAARPAASGKRSRRRAHKRQEGTLVGRVRLVSFCHKHRGEHQPAPLPALLAAGAGLGPAPQASQPQQQPQQLQQPSRQQSWAGPDSGSGASAAAGPGGGAADPLEHRYGCSRAVPFSHAARRGQRAPEAVAAAEAKRLFIASRPYLEGGPLRQEPGAAPPSRRRPLQPSDGLALRRWAEAAPAALQQLAAPRCPPCGGEEEQPGSPLAGQARLLASPSRSLKSDADRYREMAASLGLRVTIGKSGIHGWGAFAKQRHAAREPPPPPPPPSARAPAVASAPACPGPKTVSLLFFNKSSPPAPPPPRRRHGD
jgi:hypothetical protein